jgi:hypothetical protein
MAPGDKQVGRCLAGIGLFSIAAIASSHAQEHPTADALAEWSPYLAAGFLATTATTAVLFVMLILQWRGMARDRREKRAVQHAIADLMSSDEVLFSEIPARLIAVKADVELLLDRLDEPHETATAVHRPEQTLIMAAIAAVAAASEAATAISPSSEDGIVAHFDIINQLAATSEALMVARHGDDTAGTLANALRTGQLNHLLTMAPLLHAYFRDDRLYAPLRVNYGAASAVIDCLLAGSGIVTDIISPLSVVSLARAGQAGSPDKRHLGEIRAIRELVRSRARKLEDGELLIVDCLAPGWRQGSIEQPPTLIAYNRAEWTS